MSTHTHVYSQVYKRVLTMSALTMYLLWQDLTAPWLSPSQQQPERSLVLRTVDGRQWPVDPLLLHAQVGLVDYD